MHSENKLATAPNNSHPTVNTGDKDIRQRVHEALRRFGYKQVDVSKETNIHHSTLSLWLQGKIKGHQVRIEETIENWLQNIYSNKPRFTKSFCSRFYTVRESNVVNEGEQGSMNLSSNGAEEYIPIQISLNHNGSIENIRVIWNYNENVITPEILSKIIIEDHGYPASFEHDINWNIKKAIEGHRKFTCDFDTGFEENIFTIELKIVEAGISLTDSFEWDIYDDSNSPGDFARVLVQELGLPQNFENLIAFDIHSQIYNYKKYLSQSTTDNYGYETYTRQKKNRGLRDPNFSRIPQLIRKEPVNEHNIFRAQQVLESWSPHVKFFNHN